MEMVNKNIWEIQLTYSCIMKIWYEFEDDGIFI
jgi:hypothetical protein